MDKNLRWMSRPFAHRGLHDTKRGIIENSPSSVRAAIDRGYGIEVDLRPASCGTVMVFHDDTLDRLTHDNGPLADKNREQLQKISFRGTDDKMMSLHDLLDLVDGRVPLLLEVKSSWPLDPSAPQKFVRKIIKTVEGYCGVFAVMSFDPSYIAAFRALAPAITRGLVAEQFKQIPHWEKLGWRNRISLRFLTSWPRTRPDFIAYDINALPAIAPLIARIWFKRPLLTWTVRTRKQQERAGKYCDAMIFEALHPPSLHTTSAP